MMMWTLAIKSKMTAALLLCAAIGAVVLTNFGEHSNSKKINSAITSIYEDRLVVEGYIFDLSQHLDKLHHIYIKADDAGQLSDKQLAVFDGHIDAIADINIQYEKTKLTAEEQYHFDKFRDICAAMEGSQPVSSKSYRQLQNAQTHLKQLSAIQLKEARLQMDSVTSLSSFSTLISQVEMGVLIVIAILIQALVLSSKMGRSLTAQKNIGLN